MPFAYKATPEYRRQFDKLKVEGTARVDVECPRQCGTHYTLVYRIGDGDAGTLERDRRTLQEQMGKCNEHPGVIGW